MVVEPRNAVHHNILGLHLGRMGMRTRLRLQTQIMLKQNPLLSALVNRNREPDHEDGANDTDNPFHAYNMGPRAPFFKLGGLTC